MDKILIIDFGGQYTQLIARRIRELHVYAEIMPYNKVPITDILDKKYKGIILTGGPNSINQPNPPVCDRRILDIQIPILGICYGFQLISFMECGVIQTSDFKEYGHTETFVDTKSQLFNGISKEIVTWMSHTDSVVVPPNDYEIIATTKTCNIAALENKDKKVYGVQFHPEVVHTQSGKNIISNFVFKICKCKQEWELESFIETTIKQIKEKVGSRKAILALSGGVDSSVAASLMSKAIGNNLTCIFVDHGLLRKNEAKEVERIFGESGKYKIRFKKINAKNIYLEKLRGVTDPETKRKIIGEEFIRIFETEAKLEKDTDYLVQGTIYPDVIESGIGNSAVIKSHHNVGGLPSQIEFKEIIEPLRNLFKDEVREVGIKLGLPSNLVYRQPFPGPGLGIRIMGEITEEKIRIVQESDYILRYELENANLEKLPNQYFTVLTNMKSVGVMGDGRTYEYAIVIRAVQTDDFMTAVSSEIPYEILHTITKRIINEVNGVNRVLYDLTSKPPGTIEME